MWLIADTESLKNASYPLSSVQSLERKGSTPRLPGAPHLTQFPQ